MNHRLCHRRCDDSLHFAVNVSDDPPNGLEHDVQSHMFRQTITDMQDKYCGDCYDFYLIQSQYKGNHKRGGAAEGSATSFVVAAKGRHFCILALNKVIIVAVTTILVLNVGTCRKMNFSDVNLPV